MTDIQFVALFQYSIGAEVYYKDVLYIVEQRCLIQGSVYYLLKDKPLPVSEESLIPNPMFL